MQFKYYAAALLSFVVWGMFSLVLRPLSAYSSFDILTYRVAASAILIVLVTLLIRRKATLQNIKILQSLDKVGKNKFVFQSIFSSLTLALNWYLYIYVMNHISVKATSLAYLICPIITTILAALFLKEKLNIGQRASIGISILACGILSYGYFIDLVYSLFIALSYALYLVMQKSNIQFDKFFTLSIHILISSLILVPYGLLNADNVFFPGSFYNYILIIAAFFTIAPLFLNMYALKGLDSSVVGILLYINPIIAFGLAIYYFGESVSLLQGIAYVLIFIAVILFNISYLWREKFNKKKVG